MEALGPNLLIFFVVLGLIGLVLAGIVLGPRLRCLVGDHDLHAPCEGMEAEGPPEDHPCRPLPGDSVTVTLSKFGAWTRLECRRCGYVPPVCRE